MKYVRLFEEYSDDLTTAQSQLAELDSLRDFAIISAEEYKQQRVELLKKIAAYNRTQIRKAATENPIYSDAWFEAISKVPSLSWLIELRELSEYSEMIAAGFHPVASPVQLGNRTFVFAKDPNYKAGEDYAIGLFSSINVVRRLTKDSIRGGRRIPILDQKVKEFDGSLTPIQFFRDGLKWVIDNLDLTISHFPNKKMVSAGAARDVERAKRLDQIKSALSAAGLPTDDASLSNIPIDGLRGNMGDLRNVSSAIKRSVAAGGPLEVPISKWHRYSQEMVNVMSGYPNIVWTIGPSQILIDANNTSRWNLKPTGPNIGNLTVKGVLAANDLLRKFEEAGVVSIDRLFYPIGEIDLDDYPGISVRAEYDINGRLKY